MEAEQVNQTKQTNQTPAEHQAQKETIEQVRQEPADKYSTDLDETKRADFKPTPTPTTKTSIDTDAALAEAHANLAEFEERFLRAKAETENIRRRAQEDIEKAHKFAVEHFAQHLLPVLDSLEAALADVSNDMSKMRKGVELTLKQLNAAFDKGRIAIVHPTVGEPFDPHRHQAISTVPAEQVPNTVVTVLQKGYLIADRVLRPALVTVSQSK